MVKFRIQTKPSMHWKVARGVNLAIKEKFDELGIEIPFPQRVLHRAYKE